MTKMDGREMIDVTHATTKRPGRLFKDMIFGYFTSDNGFTAIASNGGALFPAAESEQEFLNKMGLNMAPLQPKKEPSALIGV